MRKPTVDELIIGTTTLCVLVEIGLNFDVSYQHIYLLSMLFGERGNDARMTPVAIDVALLAFAMVNLYIARKKTKVVLNWWTRLWPQLAMWSGVIGTVAANAAYGAHWGQTGAVLDSWPAALLAITVETGMLSLRIAAEAAEYDAKQAEEGMTDAERAAQRERNRERGLRAAQTRQARRNDSEAVQGQSQPVPALPPWEGQGNPLAPTGAFPQLSGIGMNGREN